jgi:HEAT repeat protein
LIVATRDPGVRVREAAALRLGELAMPAAAPALLERLRDDAWPLVRNAAARSLAFVGPSAEVDAALVRALSDETAEVRALAVRGLGQRGARASAPEIVARLRDTEEAPAVRAAAAMALADLCDATRLDELTRVAGSLLADRPSPDDIVVGGAALVAIGHLAPPDIAQRLAPFERLRGRPVLGQLVEAARSAERQCSASPARRAP